MRKSYLASTVPVIVNAILNEHQLVADIITFVEKGHFPRSRLGEKQRGRILASWVTRKLRTIAQFSIRDPDGANSGITAVPEEGVLYSNRGSMRQSSMVTATETLPQYSTRYSSQSGQEYPITADQIHYESSIVESPPTEASGKAPHDSEATPMPSNHEYFPVQEFLPQIPIGTGKEADYFAQEQASIDHDPEQTPQPPQKADSRGYIPLRSSSAAYELESAPLPGHVGSGTYELHSSTAPPRINSRTYELDGNDAPAYELDPGHGYGGSARYSGERVRESGSYTAYNPGHSREGSLSEMAPTHAPVVGGTVGAGPAVQTAYSQERASGGRKLRIANVDE